MPFDRRRGGLLMLMRGGFPYLLRDEFLTDQAAPISSPRAAEPGPGQVTLGSEINWLIDGGILKAAASSDSTITSMVTIDTALPRSAGMTLRHRTAQNPQGPGPNEYFSPSFGWSTSGSSGAAGLLIGLAFFGNNTQLHAVQLSPTTLQGIDTAAPNTFYTFTHIMRSSGAFHIVGDRLAFIGTVGSANMFPVVAQSSANRHTPDVDRMAIAQLGGVW